jgi:peptidoglycan hydrolase-like protein with peptidoglycan-binding domain
LKLYDGAIDGNLSAETEEAIREFKQQNGLYGDTVLDDDTLAALGVL